MQETLTSIQCHNRSFFAPPFPCQTFLYFTRLTNFVSSSHLAMCTSSTWSQCLFGSHMVRSHTSPLFFQWSRNAIVACTKLNKQTILHSRKDCRIPFFQNFQCFLVFFGQTPLFNLHNFFHFLFHLIHINSND